MKGLKSLEEMVTEVGVMGAKNSLSYLRNAKLTLPWDEAGKVDEFISGMGLMLTRTTTGAFVLWFFTQEAVEMDTAQPYQVFATYIKKEEAWITGNFNNIDKTIGPGGERITEDEIREIVSLSIDLEPINSDKEYLELFQALHVIASGNQNQYVNVEELLIDIRTVSIDIPTDVLGIAKKYLGDVVHAK